MSKDWTPEENFGVLFDNKDKQEGDKKPDMKGKINIKGEILDIAFWEKTSKKGSTFYSIKVSEPYGS